MKKIALVGSIIVDKINEISAYPTCGELAKISSVEKSVGGLVPNVSINLKKLCPSLDVYAVGTVGQDELGDFAVSVLKENDINVKHVFKLNGLTSFTEVMSVKGGQRTFFTYAGASAEFSKNHVDFDELSVDMIHLGYFMLLSKIDGGDGLEILKQATSRGIKTSIDLVSVNSDTYYKVLPCLKYVDNLIINEIEASNLTGIEITNENLKFMAQKLLSLGVRERVIIHTASVSVCVSKSGFTYLPSYELPSGYIKGTTGAGDGFCAGCLLAISKGLQDSEILLYGSLTATAVLSTKSAIGGVREIDKIADFCKDFRRKNICL